MNRSVIYFVAGALAVGVVVLGYLYYERSQGGVDIEIGAGGVSIERN